jgi:hypothetical protein
MAAGRERERERERERASERERDREREGRWWPIIEYDPHSNRLPPQRSKEKGREI